MSAAKSPYVWSPLTPRCRGIYWYRHDESCVAQLVRVFRDAGGEWCLQYRDIDADMDVAVDESDDDCDFTANWHGQWAGPIHRPREP